MFIEDKKIYILNAKLCNYTERKETSRNQSHTQDGGLRDFTIVFPHNEVCRQQRGKTTLFQ